MIEKGIIDGDTIEGHLARTLISFRRKLKQYEKTRKQLMWKASERGNRGRCEQTEMEEVEEEVRKMQELLPRMRPLQNASKCSGCNAVILKAEIDNTLNKCWCQFCEV